MQLFQGAHYFRVGHFSKVQGKPQVCSVFPEIHPLELDDNQSKASLSSSDDHDDHNDGVVVDDHVDHVDDDDYDDDETQKEESPPNLLLHN